MSEIITLTIDDPSARTALLKCKDNFVRLRDQANPTGKTGNKDVSKWASKAIYALENDRNSLARFYVAVL